MVAVWGGMSDKFNLFLGEILDEEGGSSSGLTVWLLYTLELPELMAEVDQQRSDDEDAADHQHSDEESEEVNAETHGTDTQHDKGRTGDSAKPGEGGAAEEGDGSQPPDGEDAERAEEGDYVQPGVGHEEGGAVEGGPVEGGGGSQPQGGRGEAR